MNHTGESNSMSNHGKLRHHCSTIIFTGARLYNASPKATNFGFLKIVTYVPDSKIWEVRNFVRSGYQVNKLGFCRLGSISRNLALGKLGISQ